MLDDSPCNLFYPASLPHQYELVSSITEGASSKAKHANLHSSPLQAADGARSLG